MAISTVSFPTLAAAAAREEMAALQSTLSSALRIILYLTIPAGVALFVLREPVVAVLFQRGEFNAASTQSVAWALAFYAPGLVALGVTEIITRAFYALHDTRTPVTIAVITVAVNVALSLAFIGPLSHGGLALAATLANSGEAVALLILLRRRLSGLGEPRLVASAGRSLTAALIMGVFLAVVWPVLASALQASQSIGLLLAVGAEIAGGGLIYLGTTMLLGSEEITALKERLLTRGP
jgi:putative peptidoglycan lipid II flippase